MITTLVGLAPRIYTAVISSRNSSPRRYSIALACLCINCYCTRRTTGNHWWYSIRNKVYGY